MNLQEQHTKAHLEAVGDVMRVKFQLAGFGIIEHQNVLINSADVFDEYFKWDIESLHNELESLSAQASQFVYDKHLSSPQEKTIYRELREDEMDTEE